MQHVPPIALTMVSGINHYAPLQSAVTPPPPLFWTPSARVLSFMLKTTQNKTYKILVFFIFVLYILREQI